MAWVDGSPVVVRSRDSSFSLRCLLNCCSIHSGHLGTVNIIPVAVAAWSEAKGACEGWEVRRDEKARRASLHRSFRSASLEH